jgi:hypothetical protein
MARGRALPRLAERRHARKKVEAAAPVFRAMSAMRFRRASAGAGQKESDRGAERMVPGARGSCRCVSEDAAVRWDRWTKAAVSEPAC